MWALTDADARRIGGYRLLYRLGAGGMGRVYLGRSDSGRYVALKTVHPELALSPGFRERFAREVRASRTVSGPGVVRLVAADPDAPTPWLASAYVPGPSLAQAVHDHGPFPEAAMWRLLLGLAEALSSVHECGLIHRDFKPSNVLLSDEGPQLIDFGIARAADETALTGTGLVVGSAGYMSPEQAEGTELTQSADVFALGAVLVYAATGRGPFGAGSGPELLFRLVHRPPDLGGTPAALAAVAADCLAKRPEDRPSLAELRAVAAGHGTGERDWLPGPVASVIARRAEHLLNLETEGVPDDPGPDDPGPDEPRVDDPRPDEPRVDDPEPDATTRPNPSRTRTDDGPLPPPRVAPRTAARGTATRDWLAPWVRNGELARPARSLWGLVPMLVLLMIAPELRTIVRDYPESPGDIASVGLTRWAEDTQWFMPLAVFLLLALGFLHFLRARLHHHGETTARVWTAASAVYWLVWVVAVALNTAWYAGMDEGWNEDDALPDLNVAFIAVDVGVGLALAGSALLAPVVAVRATLRLYHALTRDVAAPGG